MQLQKTPACFMIQVESTTAKLRGAQDSQNKLVAVVLCRISNQLAGQICKLKLMDSYQEPSAGMLEAGRLQAKIPGCTWCQELLSQQRQAWQCRWTLQLPSHQAAKHVVIISCLVPCRRGQVTFKDSDRLRRVTEPAQTSMAATLGPGSYNRTWRRAHGAVEYLESLYDVP